MTDKAFSDLTSASALNDADIFAITQSGTSKKIASSVVKTYMQEGFTPTSTTTLTNKTVNLTNNTLTGTIAQFNSALSDADFCTIAGSETITNKTLTTPILSATVSGTTSGRLGYLSGALSYGDGTNQQTVATLDRTQTFTAAQSFSGNVTLGDASGDTVTLNSGTVTLNNSTTISAASTKTLTLNGGAGSNGLVIDASNNVGLGVTPSAWASGLKAIQIGANSYGSAVDLNNGVSVWGSNYYNDGGNKFANAASRYALQMLQDTTNGNTSWRVSNAVGTAGNSITFTTGMTLDASGNLGLGVTPNTWYSGYTALEFKNYGAITSRAAANSMEILTNAYRNASANYVYKQTGAAQILEMANGAYNFHIASSGTAGATFTPTQAMTLDASGNLLVGNTAFLNGGKMLAYATSAFNTNTYNPLELGSASGAAVNHQLQKTTVSTTTTVILSTGLYASLVVIFGSDGTNRFIDLVLFGLGNGAVGVVSSFSASGTPAARTYSQSSSTYRLAMASGTYTVQAYAMSMNG